MSLMEELRAEYKKAYEEIENKVNKIASQKYSYIIEKIRAEVKKAEKFVIFPLGTFEGNYKVQKIVCEMLKKDGFDIREDEYSGNFEISGWGKEPSPWAEILKK